MNHRAVYSNLNYLPIWRSALPQIYSALGFTSHCPTEYAFAEAVAKWQRSAVPALQPDGILGPLTWRRMKECLGLFGCPASPRAELATWGPQSFAPAKPGTTPIDFALLARNQLIEQILFNNARTYLNTGDFRGSLHSLTRISRVRSTQI